MIDLRKLKAELALRGVAMWRFARFTMEIPPSTFSDYVHGVKRAPDGFAAIVAHRLGVKRSAIESAENDG